MSLRDDLMILPPQRLLTDATVVLSRNIAALGIYPAVDPLILLHVSLIHLFTGQEHYDVARMCSPSQQERAKDIIAILGMDELSEEDKMTVARARKMTPFLVSAIFR